jgi:hypothetical protein
MQPVEAFERLPIAMGSALDVRLVSPVYRFNHRLESQGRSHRNLILFVSLVQMAGREEGFEAQTTLFGVFSVRAKSDSSYGSSHARPTEQSGGSRKGATHSYDGRESSPAGDDRA